MKYTKLSILLFLTSSLLYAQNIPVDSIPFKLEKDNRIYTYCKVNESDTLYFLIDTGASDMVINSEIISKVDMSFSSSVENIGATGKNTVKASTENIFLWGNQKIKNTMFIAIPYPNEKWDGVIGLSILKQYVVEVNYDLMLIYLYDKNSFQTPNSDKLKINYSHNVPIIELDIETIDNNTHTLKLELDTGSDRIMDISTRYVNSSKLLNVYKSAFATSTITSSDGNSGIIYNVYFPKVKLSGLELYKIPGGLSQVQFGIMNTNEIDGIIGNWFLKRFNMTLDFKNDYLYLEPNNYIYTPFYGFLTE